MKVDVAIIGAGTAGSAAALHCARRGLRTLVIEARPLDRAGARWVNGVPGWAFDQAGLAQPAGPELHSRGVPFHLVAGWQGPAVRAEGMDLLDVDMRLLVARVQALAHDAGASFLPDTTVRGLDGDQLETSAGPVVADWVIDASGLRGARLLDRPLPGREDLCVAAQEVRTCPDPQAARQWFEARGVPAGQVACFTGIAGGYSIVNARVEGDHVSLLTGSIPALGHPSGQVMLDRFAAEHDWIGERVFGGCRALPLRAPYLRLAEGRVALIGDAACQVYATHGSGIGAGMIAGRMVAESLAGGQGVWGYAVAWQRRWGGLFAGSERFARHSRDLSIEDLGRLIAAGVMGAELVRDGLDQLPPRLPARSLPATLLGALRERTVVGPLAPVLARMALLERAYARFPERTEDVAAWAQRHRRLGVAAH